MTQRTLLGIGLSVMVFGLVTPAVAGPVNCKVVMKNLSTPGRTVEDIAETMSISVEDVKKCQEEAAAQGGMKPANGGQPAGQQAPGAAPQPK